MPSQQQRSDARSGDHRTESILDQHVGTFDREGNPITMREQVELAMAAEERGEDYRRIAMDTVGRYTVSTVLLMAAVDGRPFETAIWRDDSVEGLTIYDRYTTPEAARAGHARAVDALGRAS